MRTTECTTEARLLESLFLLTDDARDNYLEYLLKTLTLPTSTNTVVRYMSLRMDLYDSAKQQQQQTTVRSLGRRPPWIYLGGQCIRSVTRITSIGRTSCKLQHRYLTVPKSQIHRDFNNRAEDAKYQHLVPGDEPERQIASAEGVVVFILWQKDENGRQFFKSHPGPLQDNSLVLPSFVQMLRQQSPNRSDPVGSPRPENAFRQEINLRKSDEDEVFLYLAHWYQRIPADNDMY